ncbi:hypothetical protein [Eisenbergiella porci]|uniref:hypothetical protein n=1 Tax=Eisenbergiella porci TaxID=2652274 RepID=UPI002A840299|nr:hypothetical protein [Eisenbergiella porci]
MIHIFSPFLVSHGQASYFNGLTLRKRDAFSLLPAGIKDPLQATGIKLVALQSSGVFDPRGSRQISMQAWVLGSLLAGIKKRAESSIFHLFSALPHGRCSILFPLSAFFSPQ